MRKLYSLCVVLILFSINLSMRAQSYVPITVTGFNADLIANGTGSNQATNSTTSAFDNGTAVYYAHGFSGSEGAGTYGLPASGYISSSGSAGVNYQLADYSSNNALLLVSYNQSGTLTFTNPGAFDHLSILAASAGTPDEPTSFNAQVNFSDGSNTVYAFTVPDWYAPGSGSFTTAIASLGRVNRGSDSFEGGYDGEPAMYDNLINLNSTDQLKVVTSITFTKTVSNDRTGIFAVCGVTSVGTPPSVVATAATLVAGTSFTANWDAADGATSYYIDISTSSNFSTLVGSYNNYNVGNVTSLNITGLTGGTTYYYRLRAANTFGQGPNSNIITVSTSNTTPSDPTSISVTNSEICYGGTTQLTAVGAVGTVYWYTGSCGGTSFTTGNPITVNPTSTTTYYAMNYNNSTFSNGCASTTINVDQVSVGGSIGGGTTVCSGSNSTLLTLTGYTGSIVEWQYSTDGTNYTDISNTSNTYTASNLTSTTYYRAVVQSGVCSEVNSSPATITVNPLPVAGNITGGSAVCMGSTLQLTSNATGTPTLTYVWNSSNTGVATVDNTGLVTPVAQGFTNITYTVTDGSSTACTATSATFEVTVNPLPTPGFSSGATTVCAGSTEVYHNTPGGNGSILYSWVVTGGTISGSNTVDPITVVWGSGSTGTVQVTETYSNSLCSKTISENITINPLPVAGNITGGSAVCMGSTLQLASNATGTPTLSYVWNSSNTGVATVSNTGLVTPVAPGSANITYTVTDGSTTACTATSATFGVTVNQLPIPTITGLASVCLNSTENYTTELGMTGYTWNVTGGTITAGIGTNSITVTWNTTGTQSVSVNYTNTNNCTAATATVKSVTVNTLPVPIISGPTTMCSSASGNVFTTQSGMSNYIWSVPGGIITAGSGTNSITATLIASGAQTVSVNYTDPNGCTAATPTVYNVTVNGHTPVITGNPNNTGSVMVGDTDQYSTPLIPGDLYSWSASGEIGLCSGAKNCIIVHFVNPCCIYGVWTIYVTETNPSSGCSATSSKDVLVNP